LICGEQAREYISTKKKKKKKKKKLENTSNALVTEKIKVYYHGLGLFL
jgi:hypothetical protein